MFLSVYSVKAHFVNNTEDAKIAKYARAGGVPMHYSNAVAAAL